MWSKAWSLHKAEEQTLEIIRWLEDNEAKARRLKATYASVQVSVATAPRTLLNFVVFSNLFCPKGHFNLNVFLTVTGWFFLEFAAGLPDRSLRRAMAVGRRLWADWSWDCIWLTALCSVTDNCGFFNIAVHQTKFLKLGWRLKHSTTLNTTSHPLSALIKFQWNKRHWESRKLYFM